jgi:hypothetical protein
VPFQHVAPPIGEQLTPHTHTRSRAHTTPQASAAQTPPNTQEDCSAAGSRIAASRGAAPQASTESSSARLTAECRMQTPAVQRSPQSQVVTLPHARSAAAGAFATAVPRITGACLQQQGLPAADRYTHLLCSNKDWLATATVKYMHLRCSTRVTGTCDAARPTCSAGTGHSSRVTGHRRYQALQVRRLSVPGVVQEVAHSSEGPRRSHLRESDHGDAKRVVMFQTL